LVTHDVKIGVACIPPEERETVSCDNTGLDLISPTKKYEEEKKKKDRKKNRGVCVEQKGSRGISYYERTPREFDTQKRK